MCGSATLAMEVSMTSINVASITDIAMSQGFTIQTYYSDSGTTATDSGNTGMTKIPWYIWLSVLGVTSAMVGVHWDISWHRSIGRDTFWTAPHVAIQLCGVIAGITCGYLILRTTFTHSQL